MTTVQARTTSEDRLAREQVGLAQLVDRLRERFAELPEGEIRNTVHQHYEQFQDSRIRDYVLVLVERAARSDLRTLAMPAVVHPVVAPGSAG